MMSNKTDQDELFKDDDIFDDSLFLDKFTTNTFHETTSKHDNKLEGSHDKSALNVSALCCDEEISGYDKLTGRTWIYPTNYPVRDYQFNIIKASILQNTLVSLPTGLGKTFIAAVIMYNFYRWYPLGKIVFTAPTRPLVAQQIEACYNIVAIPPNDTVEMTGHMQANTRKTHWQNKRVFFATPQVIYNDIKSGICPCDKIRCLVVDEAHRARGNYAYCQIISALTEMGHKTYRILALSATPGSKVDDVINVVKNLHIAHLELRTENCIDVAPYSHTRKINTVIVQLGPNLTQLRQQYTEILDDYARRLKQLNILPQNVGNLSKGRVVMLYKEYQAKERGARHPQHNYIMKDFTLLIALFHGLELLLKHGSRVFLNFFDEHPEKSWMQSDDRLTALLERLRDDLGINPLSLNTSILPDGTVPEIPKNLCFGHPKFEKLKEIMLEHFRKAKENKQDTRAIVFCEYRESVSLVHCLLLQCRPLINPQMFVGQGAAGKEGRGCAAVSQKQQLRVMRAFRSGACNALVATCVAEEGLDVGSVDLILCFDISTRSPVRLVQRCGRTGRERSGQVFILVTEGREHQTLIDCKRQRDGLSKKILQSKEVKNNLYKLNPRLIPHDFTPECRKMFITVEKKANLKDKSDIAKKGQKDLRDILLGRASSSVSSGSSNKETDNMMTKREFDEMYPQGFQIRDLLKKPKEYCMMSGETLKADCIAKDDRGINLFTWLEWQRTLHKTVNIGHSKDTEIMASLLQYSDAKRFDMPASTQNPTFNTQDIQTQNIFNVTPVKSKQTKRKQKIPSIFKSPVKKSPTKNSPCKKDGDIRALFSTGTKSTKNYTKLITDLGILNDGSVSTKLINLFVNLSLNTTNVTRKCLICENICDCSIINVSNWSNELPPMLPFLTSPKLPDVDLIDDITLDTIAEVKNAKENRDRLDTIISINNNKSELSGGNKINCSSNFDLDFDFDSLSDCEMGPKSETKEDKCDKNSVANFNIGEIEDLFADGSLELVIDKDTEAKDDLSAPKETLGFFGLDSIDDIFADSCESVNIDEDFKSPDRNKTNNNVVDMDKKHGSPSILSGRVIPAENMSTSPILCSQVRKFRLSTKKNKPSKFVPASTAKKKLVMEPLNSNIEMPVIPDDKLLQSTTAKNNDYATVDTTNDKSMLSITQLVEMINKTANEKSIVQNDIAKEPTDLNNYDKEITSPILLSQAAKKKRSFNLEVNHKMNSQSKRADSLIILDSESDSDNTQVYDLEHDFNETDSKDEARCPMSSKRKLEFVEDDPVAASPYFSKKQKLDNVPEKPLTLQAKVLAALTSDKMNKFNNDMNINFMNESETFTSLDKKENFNPLNEIKIQSSNDEKPSMNSKLEMLQMFKRDKKINNIKSHLGNGFNKNITMPKRKINFDDTSDDDFELLPQAPVHRIREKEKESSVTNHKVRKKKDRFGHALLELEAELSGDGASGDELSDDSVGSIVDFICDDNESPNHDMHAHYLRSVKSPRKGVFKIPELPSRYDKKDVFSQYVEEDSYEMDSFCVDSHVGLTQVNELSVLEAAEIALENRKGNKKSRRRRDSPTDDEGSPLIRRNKVVKRQIHSDSEDSS